MEECQIIQDQLYMEVNTSYLIYQETKKEEEKVFAVSGRHCESGDLLVEEASLPTDTNPGDILMSTSTGAYTFAMASNYNRVPKAKVIGISSNEVFDLVKRQSFEDTLAQDS